MSNISQIGFEGEKRIRDYFVSKKIKHMQADLIIFLKDRCILAEIKKQSKYNPPPFFGHGLPSWQVSARIDFYNKYNIEPFLFVVDKDDNKIYYQSLLKLEKGKYIDTGIKKRRVYDLKNFIILQEGISK